MASAAGVHCKSVLKKGLGFWVSSLGFGVLGFGFWVSGASKRLFWGDFRNQQGGIGRRTEEIDVSAPAARNGLQLS